MSETATGKSPVSEAEQQVEMLIAGRNVTVGRGRLYRMNKTELAGLVLDLAETLKELRKSE